MNNQMSHCTRPDSPANERAEKSCRASSSDNDVPLVVTPRKHIPLGEPVIDEQGNRAMRIKKPGQNIYETISLYDLLELIIKYFQRPA